VKSNSQVCRLDRLNIMLSLRHITRLNAVRHVMPYKVIQTFPNCFQPVDPFQWFSQFC